MNPGCRVQDQLNTSEPTAPYIIGREVNLGKLPGRLWKSNPQAAEQLRPMTIKTSASTETATTLLLNLQIVASLVPYFHCPYKPATKFSGNININRHHIPDTIVVIRNDGGSTVLPDPSPTSNNYKLISKRSREV